MEIVPGTIDSVRVKTGGRIRALFTHSDPSTPFFSLRSVRLVLKSVGFVAFATAVYCIGWACVNLKFDWSPLGLEFLIFSVLKVPLAILALLIPSIAILAANHRSVQSAEMMKLTQAQNTFSNYYKHREEFGKHIEKLGLELEFSWLELHLAIFHKAERGSMRFNGDLINTVVRNIRNFSLYFAPSHHRYEEGLVLKPSLSALREDLKPFFEIDYRPEKNDLNFLNKAPLSINPPLKSNVDTLPESLVKEFNKVLTVLLSLRQVFQFSYAEYKANLDKEYKALEATIERINRNERKPYITNDGTLME